MDTEFMLTTIDNPYSPFTQYEEWRAFDVQAGYYTCELLARITLSSDELSETDQALAIDTAMNEIIELNVSGKHIKIQKDYIPHDVIASLDTVD